MQSFINDADVFIKGNTKPSEWPESPTVEFRIDRRNIVHPGDRIYVGMVLSTRGPKSGEPVDLYLVIDQIISTEKNKVQEMYTDVVAATKRLEV